MIVIKKWGTNSKVKPNSLKHIYPSEEKHFFGEFISCHKKAGEEEEEEEDKEKENLRRRRITFIVRQG